MTKREVRKAAMASDSTRCESHRGPAIKPFDPPSLWSPERGPKVWLDERALVGGTRVIPSVLIPPAIHADRQLLPFGMLPGVYGTISPWAGPRRSS
jgi:hypothetical protein